MFIRSIINKFWFKVCTVCTLYVLLSVEIQSWNYVYFLDNHGGDG